MRTLLKALILGLAIPLFLSTVVRFLYTNVYGVAPEYVQSLFSFLLSVVSIVGSLGVGFDAISTMVLGFIGYVSAYTLIPYFTGSTTLAITIGFVITAYLLAVSWWNFPTENESNDNATT